MSKLDFKRLSSSFAFIKNLSGSYSGTSTEGSIESENF